MSQAIQITHLPLDCIQPSPLNPRKHCDEAAIIELSDSIRLQGVLQPILVRCISRKDCNGKYEIVAGERRYRASLISDQETIPCIIRELNEEQALDIMIIENLQRKDIHPMEEANGFKQIIDIKHIDLKELAARVGKDTRYVAQRLQLTHLIDEIQEAFYNGLLLVKDAVTISALSDDDQRELFAESIEGSDKVLSLNSWTLNKYRHKLSDASFDITDATLAPLAGACTTCPFNSACQPLLFPEMVADPVCQRPECFRSKSDIGFVLELERAAEDPAVVLITGEYSPEKSTQKIMKNYDGVLAFDQYNVHKQPEKPERDEFDWNESEEENEREFREALQEYEKDVEEFSQKTAKGRYIKAYMLGGTSKGQYTWVSLTKKGKAAKKATAKSTGSADISADDIKAEIQRLKDREVRSKELDGIKVWDQVRPLFKPIDSIKDFTDNNLTQVELTAAAYAIYNKLGWHTRDELQSYLFPSAKKKGNRKPHSSTDIEEYFASITHFGINELLRVFFLDTLPPSAIYHGIDGDAAVMMKVAEAYWPDAVMWVIDKQNDIAFNRSIRVEKRIDALKAQLKPAKKAPAPKAKTSTRKAVKTAPKGKGLKALITESTPS